MDDVSNDMKLNSDTLLLKIKFEEKKIKNINSAWSGMQMYEKISFVLGSICSVSVIILASLQLLGIWENAINIFEPLLGVLMLTQGVLQWRRNRKVAIFSWCVAIFIFIIAFIINFIK